MLRTDFHGTVVVAVVAVRMVQVAGHQVVHMVAVRHGFVTATGAVDVLPIVTGAGVLRRASGRVLAVHFQGVLVAMVAVRVVQVAVVQVIDVPGMLDGRVAAISAVLVRVPFVLFAVVHDLHSFEKDEDFPVLILA